MKRKLILILILMQSFLTAVHAQTTGDYRSNASGAWSSISTWQRFNGTSWVAAPTAPASSDGVISILTGHTVTVNSAITADQVVVDAGGTLTITSTLTLNDGSGNDITVNGAMNFNTGTLAGTGTIAIANTATFLLSGPDVKTTNAGITITNNGTMSWTEGGINGAAPIINTGTFNISASALWQFSGGLTNTGTINKTAGSTIISTPWSNSGTINLSGGTLINGGQTFTNAGTLTLSSGAIWQNSSTFLHNTGSVVTGTGSFTNGSVLTLNIDQVFPSTLVFANSNTINGNGALTVNNDFVIQGNITGSGAFTLNGNGDWQGGTLGRSLTMAAGRTLLLSTATVKTSNSGTTLTNNGTMTWQEGGFNGSGAVINNDIFNISASALWQGGDGFTNTGTINKTAGSTTISTPWSNSGTINFSGGTLTSQNTFTNTGTITFSSGAAWQNNSTFNHNTGSVVSGTGSFTNASVLTLNIDQVFPSTLVFANSNTINGNGALTVNNDFLIQGNITGNGAFTLNGNGDWQNGTLGRSLTVQAGRTLLLSTANVKTSNSGTTLTNNGTMTWQEGGFNGSGAVINNNIFNISANALWQGGNGLTNTATINKSNTGTTNLSTPVTNSSSGIIKGVGTILFGNTVSNNGTIAPGLSPGILVINGTQPFSAGSTLSIEINDASGAGTGHDQLQRSGSLTLAGVLTVTETGTVPNGTYTIIDLTSGTVSGSFASINLPAAYMLQVNASDVQLIKNTTLPLKLISFTAQKSADNKVNLQWVTTDEQNVSHYEVQRSADGINYTRIAIVQARNSPVGGTYNYRDETPLSKTNYYRLRMVDLDAGFQISPVRKIVIDKENYSLSIYPNPAIDFVQIDFSSGEKKVQIDIFDVNGKLLYTKQMNNDLLLQVPVHSLAAGLYHLRVWDGVITANAKFVKQ